jgi:hypothetical protein
MVKVHLKGFDSVIRQFDRTDSDIEEALSDGTEEAAEHLKECIENKFGTYQQTGGRGNGPWERLKYATIARKRKKGNGGNAGKPLVDYGDMMFSFDIQTSNARRKHTASVTSDDEKILYHIYGARSRTHGVPRRDPVRPTFEEERQTCFGIVIDAVRRRIGK